MVMCMLMYHLILMNKSKMYNIKTAVVHFKLYNLIYISPTVHRVLIIGYEIIRHTIISTGLLSKEYRKLETKT